MSKSDTKKQCCVWDLTAWPDKVTFEQLQSDIMAHCKKWCFQLESGADTNTQHYQCRVSLKEKTTKGKVIRLFPYAHVSLTSSENQKNMFYCMKEDTRVQGPWRDDDPEPVYIPQQIREIEKLRPWQQYVMDTAHVWDTRHIDLIHDPRGNNGKTICKGWARCYGIARPMPFVKDYQGMMRMVMDMPTARCYIIDMPRALRKKDLYEFYAGVESLKDGYAYDDRYVFREKYFDCPNIWIFSNKLPDLELLSQDRWRFWKIDEAGVLQALAVAPCNNGSEPPRVASLPSSP